MHAGFKRLFFLNGHGGNEIPVGQALAALVAESDQADDAYLAVASWWAVGRDALEPKKLNLTTPGISHACEVETSMMLAIRPDLVDQAKAIEPSPVLERASGSTSSTAERLAYTGDITGSPHRKHGRTQSRDERKRRHHARRRCPGRGKVSGRVLRWPELPAIGPK